MHEGELVKEKRVAYFSELRAVSCVAIVVFHTFYCAARLFQPGGAPYLGTILVRNCLLWAVPCFVMVTGALLLNPEKRLGPDRVFKRYLPRAAGALLVFSFVFALFDFVVDAQPGGVPALLGSWISAVLFNGSWLHMWYLYMLIAVYLMLPIYRVISRHCSDAELRYLLWLYAAFQALVPTVNFFLQNGLGPYIFVYTVYPLYLFLGYAIHSERVRIPMGASVALVIAGTVGLLAATYFGIEGEIDALRSLSGSFSSILVLMQATGIFSLVHQLRAGAEKAPRVLLAIDKRSFGIYLLHVLVIYYIYRVLQVNPYESGGLVLLAGLSVVVLVVTWAISWVLGHVPAIKKIV